MILAFLLAISSLSHSSIASQNASYDGSALHLEGDVALEHSFGTMQATKAILTRQLQEKESFPFACIELQDHVKLILPSEASVECEKASLDFSTLQGYLSSSERVRYIDKIGTLSFELLTPRLDLHIKKDLRYTIDKAYATQDVRLIYGQHYELQTERVVLTEKKIIGPSSCTLSYQEDRIFADAFNLDLSQNELLLQKTSGHLHSFSQGEAHFTADSLLWRHNDEELILQGSPTVEERGLGSITSDQSIHFFFQNHILEKLKTVGKTSLVSTKGDILKTEGSIEISRITHLATCFSPLIYEEKEMTIRANAAQIHYREDDQGLHPTQVDLQGEIKIFSQDIQGISSTLSYNPETRSSILKAAEGEKVLFIRKHDGLRISAPEMHIIYNPETKEQEIQGIGHVIFSFSLEEQKRLNQVFQHVSSTP